MPSLAHSPEESVKKVYLAGSFTANSDSGWLNINFELRKSNNGLENRIRMHERKV